MLFGKFVKPPIKDPIHFSLYSVKELKNAKIIYFKSEECKEIAKKTGWDFDSIDETTLDNCNTASKKLNYITEKQPLPSGAIFLPNTGPFRIADGGRKELSYVNHWLKGRRPKVIARSEDPRLNLCLISNEGKTKADKKCAPKSVKLDNVYNFHSRILEHPEINSIISAYELGTRDYNTSLNDLKKYNFLEGKFALDRIKNKEKLCDGKILKRVEILITIEWEKKSSFILEGAFHMCPPK